MLWLLVLSAAALGMAAMPHCMLMCGAPCAAVTQGAGNRSTAANTTKWVTAGLFHAGRVLGYSAAGALAASSVVALGGWLQWAPALRPLWTLLHLAFLLLGLWWLVMGRQPAALQRRAAAAVALPLHWQGQKSATTPATWRAGAAGLAWVAWPCAALQAALLVAALANHAAGGAVVMAVFAVASAPGLLLGPAAWAWWQAKQTKQAQQTKGALALRPSGLAAKLNEKANAKVKANANAAAFGALGYRLAGAGLVLASGWALSHGLWLRLAAWCGL
jgi:uncharacterized protein